MRIDHPTHRNRHAHRFHHGHLHLLLRIPQCHEGHVHSSATTPPRDFSITSNPSSLNLNQGTFQTSTLTISSLNGFSGTVTLSPPSVPTGITATLNSSMVTLAAGSSKAVALNVPIGPSTTPGCYP